MATIKLTVPDTLYNELIALAQEYHALSTPTTTPPTPRRTHVRELLASKLTGAFISHLRISGVIEP